MKPLRIFGISALISVNLALVSPVFANDLLQQRADEAARLQQVEAQLERIAKRRAAMKAEIEALENDRSAISRALIAVTKSGQAIEAKIIGIEAELAALDEERTGIRTSLIGKRAVLAQVLGAMQRMGRKPPPALLVTPRDALAAVRSAIALGAVVPDLQSQSGALVAQLQRLAEMQGEIEEQRAALATSIDALAEDETRLSLLLDEKAKLAIRSRETIEKDERDADELGKRAKTLSDLIASIEKRMETEAAEADAARKADEKRRADAEARLAAARKQLKTLALETQTKTDETVSEPEAAEPDPQSAEARPVGPSTPFRALRGKLPKPAAGRVAVRFGERLSGKKARSDRMVFATRANARVSTPADGTVVYAGNFRSYGKLIIIDAGSGYHMVLSGLGEINVDRGETVLAGEPIGRMGVVRVAAAGGPALGSANPLLYVEFRKDGAAVDPGPWWAIDSEGSASNDT